MTQLYQQAPPIDGMPEWMKAPIVEDEPEWKKAPAIEQPNLSTKTVELRAVGRATVGLAAGAVESPGVLSILVGEMLNILAPAPTRIEPGAGPGGRGLLVVDPELGTERTKQIRQTFANIGQPFFSAADKVRGLQNTDVLKKVYNVDPEIPLAEKLRDPQWWREDFVEGASSFIGFLFPGMAAVRGAKLAGASTKVARKVGFGTSAALITASETGLQFEEMRNDLIAKDIPPLESGAIAARGSILYGAASGLVERGILPLQFVRGGKGIGGWFMRRAYGGVGEMSEEEVQMLLGGLTREVAGLDANLSVEGAIETAIMAAGGGVVVGGGPLRAPAATVTINGKERDVTQEQADRITSIENTPSRNDLKGVVRDSDKLNAGQRVEIKESIQEQLDAQARTQREATREPTQAEETQAQEGEVADAQAIRGAEKEVRPEESRADIRREGEVAEGAQPTRQEPEAQVSKAEFQAAVPQGEATPFEKGQRELEGEKFREGIGPDLMEAGRILSVGVKSKKLRGLMSGVFRFPPGQIELRDIRWIRTLAHEVGHAVDFRLHGNRFLSGILKRFSGLPIGERAARDELKRAAEFIRPLPEGKAWGDGTSHMKYRAGHEELMADLFSLYVLRKKKARELAPNVTAAVEQKLSENTTVQEAVTAILSPEKVEAKPAVSRAAQRTTLPEKVKPGPTPADRVLRQEVIDLVRTTVRSMEAQANRVQLVSRKWRKALKESQREDIAAFVEGIGNVNIKGDTIEAVRARMTPEMRRVAREYRFEQELNRQEVNKLFDDAGSGSEAVRFIADYIPHFYQVTGKRALEFASRWQKNTPHTRHRVLPTLKEAVEAGLKPTSLDIAFLYEKSADNNFKAALSRKFARRLKTLRTTSGEPVMVSSRAKAGPDWAKIDHPVLRHVYARPKKGGGVILGEGNAYVHPSIERPVNVLLGRPFTNWFSGSLEALNSAGKGFNVAFSFFHEFTLFESAQAVNFRFLKPLRGIFIGPFEAKSRGLGFLPKLTHRAGLILGETDTYGAEDAAKHGLGLRRSASTDYARGWMEKMLRAVEARAPRLGGAVGGALVGANIGGNIGAGIARTVLPIPLSKSAGAAVGSVGGGTIGSAVGLVFGSKRMRQLYEAYQRHLWDNVHIGLKLFAYHSIVSDTIDRLPVGVSIKQAKEEIARHINNAFGGQEFLEVPSLKRKGERSLAEPMTIKQVQLAHALVFAPDWTWSNIRVAGSAVISNATSPKSITAQLGRQYWKGMVVSLMMMHTMAQMAIWSLLAGDDDDMEPFPWDNELGHEWDVDVTPIKRAVQKTLGMDVQEHRSYVHAGKQAREVIRYFEDFPDGLFTNIGNKSSVVARTLLEQSTGHAAGSGWPAPWVDQGFNDGLEGWEQVWSRAKAAGENFVPFSWQENNFAFALPIRKGMTRYKAMRYHQDALQEHIDHPRRRDAVIALIKEIDEAARINGIDEDSRKRSFNNARSKIRGEHYRKFFEALEDQDWKEADQEAEILFRLGATTGSAKASAKRRGVEGIDAEIQSRLSVVNDELDYDRIITE